LDLFCLFFFFLVERIGEHWEVFLLQIVHEKLPTMHA
jgi:hypothetical protein